MKKIKISKDIPSPVYVKEIFFEDVSDSIQVRSIIHFASENDRSLQTRGNRANIAHVFFAGSNILHSVMRFLDFGQEIRLGDTFVSPGKEIPTDTDLSIEMLLKEQGRTSSGKIRFKCEAVLKNGEQEILSFYGSCFIFKK